MNCFKKSLVVVAEDRSYKRLGEKSQRSPKSTSPVNHKGVCVTLFFVLVPATESVLWDVEPRIPSLCALTLNSGSWTQIDPGSPV